MHCSDVCAVNSNSSLTETSQKATKIVFMAKKKLNNRIEYSNGDLEIIECNEFSEASEKYTIELR
jgi:hypothetical protein